MPRTPESKIVPFEKLSDLSQKLHAGGRRVVTTNGCFDLLHWGHLKYLGEARALGDILVCGVNSDASVKRLKGKSRPLVGERERALQMASLEAVDYVVIFSQDTPEAFLEWIRPTIHVKGGDYDGRTLPEAAVVERFGGKIQFLPFTPGYSTTHLIALIKSES